MRAIAPFALAMILLTAASGCIAIDKVNEFFGQFNRKETTFRDVTEATMVGDFDVDPATVDPSRPPGSTDDAGKRDSRSFVIPVGTRTLHISIGVDFQNDAPPTPQPPPVDPQYVDLVLTSPVKTEKTARYGTDASDTYTTASPADGVWTISLLAVGKGAYSIVAVASEPEETTPPS